MSKTIYEVNAEREPGWWIITVPGVAGAHSQARRMTEIENNAREAIAVVLDCEVDDFDVVIHVLRPEGVESSLNRSRELLAEATSLQRQGSELARKAVRYLTEDLGLNMREAGKVIGMSHQRIAQLLGPKRRTK